MSKTDAGEQLVLTRLTHLFGLNLKATGTSGAGTVNLAQGEPGVAIPTGALLLFAGDTQVYTVTTGQTISATGTVTSLAISPNLATSPSSAAVVNDLAASIVVGASDGTTAALEGSTATEASYSGFARIPGMFGAISGSGDDASTPDTIANTNVLTFAGVAGSTQQVRRVTWWDRLVGGTCYYYSDTDLNTSVAVGVNPTIAIGAASVIEK